MFFYHGTSTVFTKVDLSKSRERTDFGKGFYLASKLGTARSWAIEKPAINVKVPTVIRYQLRSDTFNNTELAIIRFNAPSLAWLDFIKENRRNDLVISIGKEPRHDYDIVSGPIADDKVAEVVTLYCNNKISADEAIQRTKALPSVFQLSLHTAIAISFIESAAYSQYINGKWNEWSPIP